MTKREFRYAIAGGEAVACTGGEARSCGRAAVASVVVKYEVAGRPAARERKLCPRCLVLWLARRVEDEGLLAVTAAEAEAIAVAVQEDVRPSAAMREPVRVRAVRLGYGKHGWFAARWTDRRSGELRTVRLDCTSPQQAQATAIEMEQELNGFREPRLTFDQAFAQLRAA